MYIKQVSRRDSRRPHCAVRPVPGLGGWPIPPRGWGLGTFTSARPEAGDPRACGGLGGLCFDLFCPGGRIEVQAKGGAPGPSTGHVLPPAGQAALSLLLCSPFIHCRCEETLRSLSRTRDLSAGPLCTPAPMSGRSYPNKGLCSAVSSIFQLFTLWGLCFGVLSQASGHEPFTIHPCQTIYGWCSVKRILVYTFLYTPFSNSF